MHTSPLPIALLMPGYFPIVGFECAHDYITVRCPACNATYVLAMPRIPKFAGTVHANVNLLKSTWGLCGHHPQEITVSSASAAGTTAF
jgi:hypothetical protein